jgi:hypothetical protein
MPTGKTEGTNAMKAHAQQLRAAFGLFITITTIVAFSAAPARAAVTPSELLFNFGGAGTGAGQIGFTSNVAASPVTGHIFVEDDGSSRIEEFTPWGNFVKAFGWDVAPGAVNEQQEVIVKATAGQFRLTFGASSTGDLEHDSAAAEVETALNGLASLSGGSVSVQSGPSDLASTRYLISFSGGSLAGTNVSQLTGSNGTTPLSGATPFSSAAVVTRADGTPGGTGLEACTAESGCKAGLAGVGVGQLRGARGIAVSADGNIYLSESAETFPEDQRVQAFDPSGRFLLMLGGEVNKTTKADICTAADESSGDECGPGVPGTGDGEFSAAEGAITFDLAGNLLVGDVGRIQVFEPSGGFVSTIATPGKTAREIDADPSGDLFATFLGEKEVAKLSPSGVELCKFPGSPPNALYPNLFSIAVGPAGELYVGTATDISATSSELHSFSGACPPSGSSEFALEHPVQESLISVATTTVGDLLLVRNSPSSGTKIQVFGPAPVDFEPPPAVAPSITDQYLTTVNPADATVHVAINPHFWTDTRYYVEYGLGRCSEGGCDQLRPAAPGVILTKAVKGSPIPSSGVTLSGLQPGMTYHYRFVAQSGGGGPVRGIGGEVGSDGTEGSFHTPAVPSTVGGCPNQVFRSGSSAPLPDCRAYEMVSPVDKNNGDIRDLISVTGFRQGLLQSAADGESIAYSSYRSFADPVSGPISTQYLARRGSGGWLSEGLQHARSGSVLGSAAATELEFSAFSADLCSAWLVDANPSPYAPGALEDFPNLYRRENCPASPSSSASYEALTTFQPEGPLPRHYFQTESPELVGYSADGTKAIFGLPFKMAENAVEGKFQLYEASEGRVSLVCVLPNGTPFGGSCSAGAPSSPGIYLNRGGLLTHAISEDGSRIYWTDSGEGPGRIYLRLNGDTTLAVSETQTAAKARFLGASADGSSALFTVTEKTKARKLYQYSLETESSSEIAGEVMGVAGINGDLSYIYFVSKEALGEANAEGRSASPGKPNLYLRHDGTDTFIATLSQVDVEPELFYSNIATQPIYQAAHPTADGLQLTFISANSLTGADNIDVNSGKADAQVFQYSAATGELNCISCNPAGARPQGREIQAPAAGFMQIAALVPIPVNQLYTPRAQSEDGNRVFFNSYDALVPGDTNGKADVYEWERLGSGNCMESAGAYSPVNGGCLYLISNGTSPIDSEFVDSSHNGRDVFFTTDASLVPQDPGLIDLYDARAGGGFPPPPSQPAACEGEACQGPLSPPNDPTPASASFHGAGNVKQGPARKKQKSKKQKSAQKKTHAKKKGKQVKKSAKRANENRRSAR